MNSPEKQYFDYTVLETETRTVVQQYTNEIKSLIRRTSQDIISIGERLFEVKNQLGHGKFINWLKLEFNWSISTATRFMRVKEEFKFVNLTNLHIKPSALYLLAAHSTPEQAKTEALERASLGEIITYSLVQTIINKHNKAFKAHTLGTATSNSASENKECNLYIPIGPPAIPKSVEVQSTTVTESSIDQLPKKKTIPPGYSQTSNQDHHMISTANGSDYSPNNQSQMDIKFFEVGEHLCISDYRRQNHKWFGKVVEVKKATASDIEVVIKISLQPTDNSKETSKN